MRQIGVEEPGVQGAEGVADGVLGDPVQVEGPLLAAFATVALDPYVERQDVYGRSRRGGAGGPVDEVGGLGERSGRARVHELEHAVVGLAVVRVALVDLREDAPRAGWQHRGGWRDPVLGHLALFVEEGEGEQADPGHGVGRVDAGGLPAGRPGFLPQLAGAGVSGAVGANGPFDADARVHHERGDAVRLLGPPGLDHVGSGGDGGEHLGALGPQAPVVGAFEQARHGDPATGAQVLGGGTQLLVVAGRVVDGPEIAARHHLVPVDGRRPGRARSTVVVIISPRIAWKVGPSGRRLPWCSRARCQGCVNHARTVRRTPPLTHGRCRCPLIGDHYMAIRSIRIQFYVRT